ncbi:MAG: hypothetical protein IT379_31110 [Deltaproteobacteria bacterium]|nr:hypothetical protein [Deltaproteobacteria bacterium]
MEATRPFAGGGFEDRIAVVVNGNAKRVTDDLVDTLSQIVRDGDLFVSRTLEEGEDIARTITERGYHTVLTGGGDGTFVHMVTLLVKQARAAGKRPPRFGLLRLGTGNALAWVLGAGQGVVADLARIRREAGSSKLKVIEVDGKITPFAGMGIDGIALNDYNRVKDAMGRIPVLRPFAGGGLAYLVSIAGVTAPSYLLRKRQHVRIVNTGAPAERIGPDGQPDGPPIPTGATLFDGKARAVAVGTIPYYGFGVRIFPFAADREDRMNLRIVDTNVVEVGVHIREIWKGRYRSPNFMDYFVEKAHIEFEPPTALQIGGDPAGVRESVDVAMAEPIDVVDFYAPPAALGSSEETSR